MKNCSTMLAVVHRKDERYPINVLNDDNLKVLYTQTDLEFSYVCIKCAELIIEKNCQISNDQMVFWYRDFLKEGWTKKIFDERFEVIKRVEKFGNGLDYHHWTKAERMYREDEVRFKVETAIRNRLTRGASLLAQIEAQGLEMKQLKLTDEDKKCIALQAIKEVDLEIAFERERRAEEYKHSVKTVAHEKTKARRRWLKELPDEKKRELIELLIKNELLIGDIEDFTQKHFFDHFGMFYTEVIQLEEKLGRSIFQLESFN